MVVLSVATQLVLRSFSEGGRVTTENAPFANRNKNFLPFLKTFEITSRKSKKSVISLRELHDPFSEIKYFIASSRLVRTPSSCKSEIFFSIFPIPGPGL